jgi:hypothetical protein
MNGKVKERLTEEHQESQALRGLLPGLLYYGKIEQNPMKS